MPVLSGKCDFRKPTFSLRKTIHSHEGDGKDLMLMMMVEEHARRRRRGDAAGSTIQNENLTFRRVGKKQETLQH